MSYQVFARKYRPQTFAEVVGQQHVTRTLANAIGRGRLAHAFLFVGPRGTGKTSTARILAKSLNCERGPTVDPCGSCSACNEVAAGNSLDVLEIDGASNNGVEQVRELRENARFAPARDRFKIYIIDEVHMLSSSAFNALLKTLEEPPAHVKFIFATTEVHKVLPTILSRCQRFDMRRIPAPSIAEHLLKIAMNEQLDLSPGAANEIARAADGGMRDAESMLDQLAAFCGSAIGESDVMSVFGITPAREVAALFDKVLDRDAPGSLDLLHSHDEAGRDLGRFMADFIQHARSVLVAGMSPEHANADAANEMAEVQHAQAARISAGRLLELIDQFAAAEGRMRWAPNKRLQFEVALLRAIQSLGETTLEDVLNELQGGVSPEPPPAPAKSVPASPAAKSAPPATHTREKTQQADPDRPAESSVASKPPTAAPTTPPPEPATAPDSASQQEQDPAVLWQHVVEHTVANRPLAAAWVRAGHGLRRDKTTLVVGFAPAEKAARDQLSRPKSMAYFKKVLATMAGEPLDLVFELSDTVPTVTHAAAEQIDDDKLIDRAVEILEARVISRNKNA